MGGGMSAFDGYPMAALLTNLPGADNPHIPWNVCEVVFFMGGWKIGNIFLKILMNGGCRLNDNYSPCRPTSLQKILSLF
jgi:hypothetical protein